jgi:hypothetical protein
MFDNISALIKEFETFKQEFQKNSRQELKKVFKEFFEKVPEIKTVQWVQYTPYFNDGDPCVFRVCDPMFSNVEASRIEGYEEIEDQEEGEFCTEIWKNYSDVFPTKEVSKESFEIMNELSKILTSSVMRPILEEMFDDHVQVTATADGFDVEDYEHD